MSAHIGRLENYVSAMSRLQRLEDVEIHRTQIPALEFAREMRESAEILCGDKTLKFVASPGLFWNVDAEVVMQVFENLLSNAVRYARTTVAVQVDVYKRQLPHESEPCRQRRRSGDAGDGTELWKARLPGLLCDCGVDHLRCAR